MAELTHEQLWQVCQRKPGDYEPYGQRVRSVLTDCSSGCKWFHPLRDLRPETGASAAIHGVLVLDFSHLSIRVVQSLSRNDWVFSQSNRSKAPSNSQ